MDMSAAQKFKVMVSGSVAEGQDPENAMMAFAEQFKLNTDKARAYFAGEPKILRQDLDEKGARAYMDALLSAKADSDQHPHQGTDDGNNRCRNYGHGIGRIR